MERVMITLPDNLLKTVDETARRLSENRSQFVRQALLERLERLRQQEFEALLAEGYQVMAEEMATLAEESLPLQAAAAEKAWQWDE
jgi:metal-responsive CopG/Arc/MetJ family transcriptional regulator